MTTMAPLQASKSTTRSALGSITTPFRAISRPLGTFLNAMVWVILLGAWFLLTQSGAVPSIFLPSPERVLATTIRMAADGTLFQHVVSSSTVVLLGFAVSSIVAMPLGLAVGSYRAVQSAFEPLVNFTRYLPVTSFVPLFILWIGIGIEQRVAVIIFGVFFQQIVMIADSARNVPRDIVNVAYTLGTSRTEIVRKVVLPYILPDIIDTLRVTIGWAWTFVVIAEMVAADSGLGYISLKAMRGFQVDIIFMSVAIIGILGLLTDRIFVALRRHAAPWAL